MRGEKRILNYKSMGLIPPPLDNPCHFAISMPFTMQCDHTHPLYTPSCVMANVKELSSILYPSHQLSYSSRTILHLIGKMLQISY